MRKRLFINMLAITAIVLTVFGVTVAIFADFWYTDLMVDELRKDCAMIAARADAATSIPDLAETASRELSAGNNNVRITLIAQAGEVLGDSSTDWKDMESHKNRPEVIEAYRNGWGTAQRYSDTLKVTMLYVAVVDQKSLMCVRAAMPLYEISRIYWVLAAFIGGCLIFSLVVAVLIANRTSKRLSEPIVALSRMTSDIASGNYAISAMETRYPEFQQLSTGLIRLANDLDNHVSALESSNTRLTTVLASISEGLIAMDGEGRLLFVNAAASAILSLSELGNAVGQKAATVIPVQAITNLAADCLAQHSRISSEIQLTTGVLLQATASPMRPPADGCIILLMDVTQLRKLENIRRDFVSNVTHELRTPLTSIRGYVETLQAGALDNRELSTKFLEIIEIESERLSNLINDLLYLSEIESSTQDTGVRRFHLADIANSVVEMLQYTASARSIAVSCTIGDDVLLEANPDRIKQLLINLADNAVKYNHDGGSVTISAERTHGLVRVSVKDTGIGIPQEHISRIFERFYRVDRGRSRSMGGTGLGLSIVKHIVDLYRGNIRLISEAGRGSEFIIELPVKYEAKKKA